MKIVLSAAVLVFYATVAFSMVGGPIFCIGEHMTAMTVEASRVTLKTNSPSGSGSQNGISDRLLLTARYGMLPNVDLSGSLGTASLGFDKMYGGYSDFKSGWSFAWGASARVGYPIPQTPLQAIGVLHYTGFMPRGSSSNGTQSISNKYIWHEIAPAVAVGSQVGPVIPYLGISKPFLFGRRDIRVTMNGREFPAAGGENVYSDGEQPLRAVLGVEWKLPQGYSLTGEGTTTFGGVWALSIGIAQTLK